MKNKKDTIDDAEYKLYKKSRDAIYELMGKDDADLDSLFNGKLDTIQDTIDNPEVTKKISALKDAIDKSH